METLEVFKRARVMLLLNDVIIFISLLVDLKRIDAFRTIMTFRTNTFLDMHHLRSVHTTIKSWETVMVIQALQRRRLWLLTIS